MSSVRDKLKKKKAEDAIEPGVLKVKDNIEENDTNETKTVGHVSKQAFSADRYAKPSTQPRYEDVPLSKLINPPKFWYTYPLLTEDKLVELMFSIKDRGLLQPIVVWEQEDGNLMRLAGANRANSYSKLLEVEGEQYCLIPAIVYPFEALDLQRAEQIHIDTNWTARELSKKDKIMSIIRKFELIGEEGYDGTPQKTRAIIAKDLEITTRQVYKYYAMRKLIPTLLELVMKNKISIDNAYILTDFDNMTQSWIYETFTNKLQAKYLKKIQRDMTKSQIEKCFIDEKIRYGVKLNKALSGRVKKLNDEVAKEFEMHINQFFKEKGIDTI